MSESMSIFCFCGVQKSAGLVFECLSSKNQREQFWEYKHAQIQYVIHKKFPRILMTTAFVYCVE